MVYILNGEILADNDPRAQARMQQNAGASGTASSRFSTLTSRPGGEPVPDARSANQSQPGSPEPGRAIVISSPAALTTVEKALGLRGKTIMIPSILGRPELRLPLLYVIFLVILVYMGGPRAVLPLVAIGYWLATSPPTRARN